MKRAGLRIFQVQKAPYRWLPKPLGAVMDDEIFIKADAQQMPGLEFFVAQSRFDVLKDIRKKKVDKFANKKNTLAGHMPESKTYNTTGNINSEIYRTQYLQNRLLTFLRSYGGKTLF